MTVTISRRAAVAVLVIAVAVALLVWRLGAGDAEASPAAGSAGSAGAAGDGGSTAAAPYDDPQAAGLLTLCSADGEAVTSGSVDDRPFADLVVGATGLPDGVDPAGAVATVFAYQPREGTTAAEFSGTPLTAATELADPAAPAVPVTADGWSVRDFVTAYPATWDGFVQLRTYLGTPAAGTLTETPYDTADLRVDGDRWELVRGGSADCGASDLEPDLQENR